MTESQALKAARLKAALRENLRKRKAQERDRQQAVDSLDGPGSAPAER